MCVSAILALLAGAAVTVEVTAVGDVPREVQLKVKSELEEIFSELGVAKNAPAPEERLSIILVAGAINIRCIASRPGELRTAEANLTAGSLTFRPGLDELVLRLYPGKRPPPPPLAPLQPAAAIEPPPKANIAPFIALGVGAGLLLGGVLLGAHASSGIDALRNEPMSPADFRDTADRANTESWAANIFFVSSAVCGVVAAALFFDE